MKTKKTVVIGLVALIALGSLAFRPPTGKKQTKQTQTAKQDTIKYWTCVMHKKVREKKPGSCPICGMKLVPVKNPVKPLHATALPKTKKATK